MATTWSAQGLEHLARLAEQHGPSPELRGATAALRVLARSEVSATVLSAHLPVGIVHVGANGAVWSANDRAALFLGLRSTLQGQLAHHLFPPEHAAQVEKLLAEVRADGAVRTLRFDAFPEARTTGIFVVSAYRAEVVPGEIGVVLVIETDADEVLASSARSADQERRYQSIFQHSADSILLFDKSHHCLDANLVAHRLLGLPADLSQVMRSHLWETGVRAQTELRVQRQIDGDTGTPIECVVAGVSGPCAVEVNALPLSSRSYQVVLRSLEERRSLERDRRELEARAFQWEKMEALGRLAGGVVHDMNNILAVIANYAALLEMSAGTEVQDDARSILAAARRGKQLTGNLLRFTRGAADVRVPTSLQNVVKEGVELLRRLLARNIEVVVELPPEPLRLLADTAQLVQVVVNLGTNAGHAMERGGRLTISLTRVQETALLRITDDGIGIPPENLHRVIEPFFTTKPTGSGLGLSSAYGTVKAHGGHLEVTSVPGEGTTLSIELPLPRVVPVTTPPSMPPVRLSGELKGTVLVVDDEPDIRIGTVRLLRRLGLDATSEPDGPAALHHLESNRCDLVVLDLDMPVMDGLSVLRKLLERDPHTRVLVASGYGREHLPAELAALATVRFVRKPFRFSELERAVRELLAERPS